MEDRIDVPMTERQTLRLELRRGTNGTPAAVVLTVRTAGGEQLVPTQQLEVPFSEVARLHGLIRHPAQRPCELLIGLRRAGEGRPDPAACLVITGLRTSGPAGAPMRAAHAEQIISGWVEQEARAARQGVGGVNSSLVPPRNRLGSEGDTPSKIGGGGNG